MLGLATLVLTACGGGDDSSDPGDQSDVDEPTPDAVAIDAGEAPDGGTTTPDATTGDKLVFATSVEYTGDLRSEGDGVDGLDGADRLCQLHAAAGRLPGVFKAWLSTPTEDAIDRIVGEGPWLNMFGDVVFPNRATLQTTPLNAVFFDENGDEAYGLWTGTAVGGELADEVIKGYTSHCHSWTSASGNAGGSTGSPDFANEYWTEFDWNVCEFTESVLCFQQ